MPTDLDDYAFRETVFAWLRARMLGTEVRTAMNRHVPLVWFVGVGYVPGSFAQVFVPRFPVWLVAEEPNLQQFAVAVEHGQRTIPIGASAEVVEITKKYNERIVMARHHQPLFRAAVLCAYQRRCAVCRLPFTELLDAAHIKGDSVGAFRRAS